MKNFFRNIFARLLNIKFITITVKDYNITQGKTPNNIYPGREFFVRVNVPQGKLIDFKHYQTVKEFVVLDINGKDLLFDIVSLDYIYDLMTGSLLEIVLYSNLQANKN